MLPRVVYLYVLGLRERESERERDKKKAPFNHPVRTL